MKRQYLIKIGDKLCPSILLSKEEYDLLTDRLAEILSFFKVKNISPINLYLFQNAGDYLKLYGTVSQNQPLMGSYQYDSAYIYADLTEVSSRKFLFSIMHELVHIVYQNYIQEKGISKRVIWVSEGLAQNLSGEKESLIESSNLHTFLQEKVFASGKIIPDISYFARYGNTFGTFTDHCTNKYNGYDWAYLMIKYLMENLNYNEFQNFIRNYTLIKQNETKVLANTANHFSKMLKHKTK